MDYDHTKTNDIYGEITDLILYNGERFNIINPPLFKTMFSSFYYNKYNIYYWGFDNDSNSSTANYMMGCRYNILNKEFKKIALTNNILGTDDIGAYPPPSIKNDNVEFHTDTGSWLIDKGFERLIKKEKINSIIVN